MRAFHVPAAGEQQTPADLPVPTSGEGQVLVGVMAAGLNAFDKRGGAGTDGVDGAASTRWCWGVRQPAWLRLSVRGPRSRGR